MLELKPTFLAFANDVAFAGNKHHITLYNPVGSGYNIQLERLLGYNLQLAAVTGVAVRMELLRCGIPTGGTVITPVGYDLALDGTSPAGLVITTNSTSVASESRLFAFGINNDEIPATNSNATGQFRVDVLTALPDTRTGTLRPGEGITLKQITASTVGLYGWQLVYSVHARS